MATKVINLSGNGQYSENQIIDFSYTEEAQSLIPSSIDGGTSQISFNAVSINEDKVGNTRPNSKLLLNNSMSLVDDAWGSVNFQVKNVSISDGALVSVTGDTAMQKLNVVKTAKPFPHQGSDYTLKHAIIYYCELCDVTPVFDDDFGDELELTEPKFLGWKDNVWEKLKQLCAGVSGSREDNIGIEMYISNNELHFRKALQTAVDVSATVKNMTLAIDTSESAKQIDVANYNTYYAEDAVIYEDKSGGSDDFSSSFKASITDSMQVNAGETLTKRFVINGTLETVNQPECVSQITPLPYDGIVGKYVIVGNDNLPIQPTQWVGQGGSLTVKLTDVPNEIELTIVAPPVPQLPKADNPSQYGYSPYKIGVESSGEADYPALYITGTGVFHRKNTVSIPTGSSENITTVDESPTTVDNIFIWSEHDASCRGVAAAQAACGPQITLSQSIDTELGFGELVGSVQALESSKFRVTSAAYSQDGVSITSKAYVSFSDFNAKWSGKTIANFNSVMLDPATYPNEAMLFNEFSIIPLIESN